MTITEMLQSNNINIIKLAFLIIEKEEGVSEYILEKYRQYLKKRFYVTISQDSKFLIMNFSELFKTTLDLVCIKNPTRILKLIPTKTCKQ